MRPRETGVKAALCCQSRERHKEGDRPSPVKACIVEPELFQAHPVGALIQYLARLGK